jgi:hypothetical protein
LSAATSIYDYLKIAIEFPQVARTLNAPLAGLPVGVRYGL